MRDIRSLDLNLLKALDALLDERSVTGAAERLALTQPAVSGMLARLRDAFDDPLFVRARRGVAPTDRALALAGPVKAVLAGVEGLLRPAAFDPAQASFTLTLAATDFVLQALVAPFVAVLRRRAPGVSVAIKPMEADRVLGQFERGEVDIAFMAAHNAPPGVHLRRLFDDGYVCAMRADHPDAAAPLTLQRFCALDHALVSYFGEPFFGPTDAALAKLGLKRRVALSVTSFLVLMQILRTTDLIAVAPRRLVADAEGLLFREPPLEIPGFSEHALWHERTHNDPGRRWARDLLAEVASAADTTPDERLG